MNFDLDKFANGTGDVLWLIFGGLLLSICYYLLGVIYFCTIIGIPLGVQLFKIGKMCIRPFGYSIGDSGGLGSGCISVLLNIVWFFLGGIELALLHWFIALICCCTIVLVPFGIAHFKLGYLALVPFGKSVEKY